MGRSAQFCRSQQEWNAALTHTIERHLAQIEGDPPNRIKRAREMLIDVLERVRDAAHSAEAANAALIHLMGDE